MALLLCKRAVSIQKEEKDEKNQKKGLTNFKLSGKIFRLNAKAVNANFKISQSKKLEKT